MLQCLMPRRCKWCPLLLATVLLMLGTACGEAAESGSSSTTPAASEPVAPVVSEPAAPVVSESASAPAASEASSAVPEGTVHVLLSEWIVEPSPTTAAAGAVTFQADDQGGEEHEMVIVRADDPAALPTDADGAVDEDQIPEDDFIDEVEELEPGTQDEVTVTLDPGSYVLFCNITDTEDDGTVESHFANGMSTTFTVND